MREGGCSKFSPSVRCSRSCLECTSRPPMASSIEDPARVGNLTEVPADAKAAGLLKKQQELEKRKKAALELAEQKQAAKEAERARRAKEAEEKLRQDAAASTFGLDVRWDVEFARTLDGVVVCLDLWRQPQEHNSDSSRLAPTVMWLHGGGWKFGTHHMMPRFLRRLTDEGYVIASIGYRKSGVAPFPACIHDCKTAVRWLKANGESMGLDPERVVVVGNSAGAHLAALLGVTVGNAQLEGSELGCPEESSAVSAVVAIAGPMDLAKTCKDPCSAKTLEALLLGAPLVAVPEMVALASPSSHVCAASAAPPFLLIHGDDDEEVSVEHSESMCAALVDLGFAASFARVAGGRHPKFGESREGPEACLESARSSWSVALERRLFDFLDFYCRT